MRYSSSGLGFYRHADWQGSTRLSSTPTRTLWTGEAYAPFGELYDINGSDGSFTGVNSWLELNLWDFPFRRLSSSQGRWISVDPADVAAVNPMNPQSWNRYAYVLNNPLALIDPLGLGATAASCGFALDSVLVDDGEGDPWQDEYVWTCSEGDPEPDPDGAGAGGSAPSNPALQKTCLAKVQSAVNSALGTQTNYLGPTAGISDPNLGPGARGGAFNYNFFAPGYSVGPIGPGVFSGADCGRFPNAGSGSLHIPVPGGGCNPSGDPTIWASVNGGFQFTAHIDSANPFDDLVSLIEHLINNVIRKVPYGC